ncbi:unnamed protein product (macronuclear) [Paramecium tetraurelia]|uniref:Uncharacterized protein n=1 Tax=Paramecium tetraurelia TaxID=5888 RepID=A0DNH4_PARTE|nr:uncharacterized protein GSPATT00018787001 [Paramecium tetraurelia]CAK84591.1 unnamed protein product [Paramecium tetraurelia]|eukprot:XP_001451988.1 hypothetical protein (macronuclear) [Paramecium tetraurelia strain d4-2]
MSLDNSFENIEEFMLSFFNEVQNENQKEGQYVLDSIVQEEDLRPQLQTPKSNGKAYRQLFEIVQRLNDINWVEPYTKITPIKHFTPITFWFIICSQYFQKDVDPKRINIEEEITLDQKDKESRPYTYFDDWFILEMRKIVNFNLRQMVKRIITQK